jgi:PRTRC genetic system ThiF family protein
MPPTKKKIRSKTIKAPVAAPAAKRLKAHYTADYLINPAHPVTINLIGCGGTGSQVITSLARMHVALRALGHPGLYVRAIDPKIVTEANFGRQLFSVSDIGQPKCTILVGRINRFFSLDWESAHAVYDEKAKIPSANITISCVDSGPARKKIKSALLEAHENSWPKAGNHTRVEDFQKIYYWMDFGNSMDRGQVVISTLGDIEQPKDSGFDCRGRLPTVDKLHRDIFNVGKANEQAEALTKQDLFINTNLANMGLAILWKMFRQLRITYHGCYVNLSTMLTNPIPIQ